MKAIVVVDDNWAIGNQGRLLARLPGDLAYFREKTLGKTVVMGRATLESLPGGKPLPGRRNVVLSGSLESSPDYLVCRSVQEVYLTLVAEGLRFDDAFVIGGESVYKALLPYCDYAYVTKIEGAFPADKYFVDLDALPEWELVRQGDWQEENLLRYRFTEYRRII